MTTMISDASLMVVKVYGIYVRNSELDFIGRIPAGTVSEALEKAENKFQPDYPHLNFRWDVIALLESSTKMTRTVCKKG